MAKRFENVAAVAATVKIWNRKGTEMLPGDKAAVFDRYPADAEDPRIVSLRLPDGRMLLDIVDPNRCLREL